MRDDAPEGSQRDSDLDRGPDLDLDLDLDDDEDFHEALSALLAAADAAGVDDEAVAGLLTVHLARRRGDVRLPLGMPPERARALLDRVEDHEGETMEVEVLLTEEVFDELELQLSAVEGTFDVEAVVADE